MAKISQARAAELERKLSSARASLAKKTRESKTNIEDAAVIVTGGGLAGYLDGYQAKKTAETGSNPLEFIEDVPTEGLLGVGLVLLGVYGMKSGRNKGRVVNLGAGMAAYSAGTYARDMALEAK